jgi:uncharacterized glyoxalase superfamily protein PhnB
MKPTPPGWPRISQALYYEEAAKAIDFICAAFGFEVQIRVEGEDGRIEHSELVFGEGLIMVGDVRGKEKKFPYRRSPSQISGMNTQSIMVYVDDVEAHFARAKAAGATIHGELSTVDYGEDYWSDRGYECEDIGGHHWWFYERLRNPPAKP